MINFDFVPPYETSPDVRVMYNVGALMDIPSGQYYTGRYGETIVNGGAGIMTGIVGAPNTYKSTVADYMANAIMFSFPQSRIDIYDTEINRQAMRMALTYMSAFHVQDRGDFINRIHITDKSVMLGNEWWEKRKEFIDLKVKHAKEITINTPFLDRNGKVITALYPTPSITDSLSAFETDADVKMQDDNELGESGLNTLAMRQANNKSKFISDLNRRVAAGQCPAILTAHVGKVIQTDPRQPPPKKLASLKNGDVIKGVSDNFLFLTTICWQCNSAVPLTNDGTGGVEYPSDGDSYKGDKDQIIITMTVLRNKNGPTGNSIQLIASQRQGIKPELSEFHYIKTCDRYGISGTLQNYTLDIYPEVKLSRTAIATKLEKDVKLRRAVGILADMCQKKYLHHFANFPELECTPQELFEGIKKQGYDWDMLLSKTRRYWVANDEHHLYFLSTVDLLKMRLGRYHPYWLAKDKVTILPKEEWKLLSVEA